MFDLVKTGTVLPHTLFCIMCAMARWLGGSCFEASCCELGLWVRVSSIPYGVIVLVS